MSINDTNRLEKRGCCFHLCENLPEMRYLKKFTAMMKFHKLLQNVHNAEARAVKVFVKSIIQEYR